MPSYFLDSTQPKSVFSLCDLVFSIERSWKLLQQFLPEHKNDAASEAKFLCDLEVTVIFRGLNFPNLSFQLFVLPLSLDK